MIQKNVKDAGSYFNSFRDCSGAASGGSHANGLLVERVGASGMVLAGAAPDIVGVLAQAEHGLCRLALPGRPRVPKNDDVEVTIILRYACGFAGNRAKG